LGIHLEPVMAVLRAGDRFSEFGDAYEFSATVICRGHRAEIVGAAGRFRPKWRKALLDTLFAWGITEVFYERKGSRRRAIVMNTGSQTVRRVTTDP
jgi:hypothetical protein